MEVAVTNLVSTLWTFSGLCSLCSSQRSKDMNVCRVRDIVKYSKKYEFPRTAFVRPTDCYLFDENE